MMSYAQTHAAIAAFMPSGSVWEIAISTWTRRGHVEQPEWSFYLAQGPGEEPTIVDECASGEALVAAVRRALEIDKDEPTPLKEIGECRVAANDAE